MQEGLAFAASHPALLTVGITPTFPATGYGYIQTKQDPESAIRRYCGLRKSRIWQLPPSIWQKETISGIPVCSFGRHKP